MFTSYQTFLFPTTFFFFFFFLGGGGGGGGGGISAECMNIIEINILSLLDKTRYFSP